MILNISHYKEITILQVFIIVITFVTCANSIPENIDLPLITDKDDYIKYAERPKTSGDQVKLNPIDMFRSIYNLPYRAMPIPHSKPDYEEYVQNFKELGKKIDLNKLSENIALAKKQNKVAMADIYQKHYDAAFEFNNIDPRPSPLDEYNYFNALALYDLFPKQYENTDDFYKARYKLANFIQQYTPEAPKTLHREESTNLNDRIKVEAYHKDVYLKNEPYRHNLLRMIHNEKLPLYGKKYNEIYGTNEGKWENEDKKTQETNNITFDTVTV